MIVVTTILMKKNKKWTRLFTRSQECPWGSPRTQLLGVGVMQDEKVNLEGIEVSYTLGDVTLLTYTLKIHECHGLRQTMSVWVVIADGPVYIREHGGGGRGAGGIRNTICAVMDT